MDVVQGKYKEDQQTTPKRNLVSCFVYRIKKSQAFESRVKLTLLRLGGLIEETTQKVLDSKRGD